MDHYQEPGMSENNYEPTPAIQQPQHSQMTYESPHPQVSPSIHDETSMQGHQSPQMPVYDAMSNLHLENQIQSTSGAIGDSPSSGRITRARTRGINKYTL